LAVLQYVRSWRSGAHLYTNKGTGVLLKNKGTSNRSRTNGLSKKTIFTFYLRASNYFTMRILYITLLLPFLLQAQINLNYQEPHETILSLADAERPPLISMNTDGTKALLLYRSNYVGIAELAETELRLAGLRINPVTNISSRARFYHNIALYNPETMEERAIKGLPDNPRITHVSWSKDQNLIAFTNTTAKGVELWMVDYRSAKAKKLTDDNLNANMGRPYIWNADDSGFIVRRLPKNRPALIDTENDIPNGPIVSVNEAGTEAQNRTYQDLLKSPNDEANFETLATSEIWRVNLKGKQSLWRSAGMYRSISPSPNGAYLMVSEIKRPFSYIVPYSRFPTSYDILNSDGKLVHTIEEVPLTEELPKGFMSVRTGKRSIQWRDDQPATIVYAEALDDGDARKEVDFRDVVYQLPAPFDGDATELLRSTLRFSGIEWGNDTIAVVSEYWWNTRTARVLTFNPSKPNLDPVLFNERNYQDRYADPGRFTTVKNEFNRDVLDLTDGLLWLIGDGYSPDGKFPFVDAYNLATYKTIRMFQATGEDTLQSFSRFADREGGWLLVRIESATMYPNYILKNIHTNEVKAITAFKNPFAAMADVHKETLEYTREDGLPLSATLYLPADYDTTSGEKLPMIMWAYPREYKDRASAGQVTASSNSFTFPYYGSPIYWVTRGYAVLDNTAFPIVGEGDEEPNDSFIEQLVGNAKAAIDVVAEKGYIDRKRVAVGGHSYGAFMTANLLTHSDLFAAGIARSGAYNRTLTPFGFQSEERNYWEAPEIYHSMSPFSNAHKMKTPLLLIHGSADNNSGTYPMQSERYFNALKGLGAPVRLVMLPLESHGYAARESVMHMLWEQDQWLEKHLKKSE